MQSRPLALPAALAQKLQFQLQVQKQFAGAAASAANLRGLLILSYPVYFSLIAYNPPHDIDFHLGLRLQSSARAKNKIRISAQLAARAASEQGLHLNWGVTE
jgi:hypothetical protein